jgi:2,3-bisphosphoglycerate-independent phosphoglycerate mutase
MPRVLFLFLDGIGLGANDPHTNPLVAARLPAIRGLLEGRLLAAESAPFEGHRATLVPIDACLGVPGDPESASGQAALLTGRNIPLLIGGHYGPKPNQAIEAALREDNLFAQVLRRGGTAQLLNAYPPRYFDAIRSRYRMYSSIPLAATLAGLPLMTADDLQAGRALSADFTGIGWAAQPDFPPAPVYSPERAGQQLAHLSLSADLTWFDYWPSDYAGHRASLQQALTLLETFDRVLGGLAEAWADRPDLIVLTSDHGNLEDLAHRGHTLAPVPGLLIGPRQLRRAFARGLTDLTRFHDAILRTLFDPAPAGPGA